jgi:hypothetical protein
VKGERRRVGFLVGVTTLGLIVVVGLHPVSADRIAAGYVLALAAIGLAAVTRILAADSWRDRHSQFEHVLARKPAQPTRPSELVRIEREITLGGSSAGNLYTRLLPLLRDAATARLGIDFDLHPDRARAVLGAETWELLRPDRPAPVDRNAPGLPLRRVRTVVDQLEQL